MLLHYVNKIISIVYFNLCLMELFSIENLCYTRKLCKLNLVIVTRSYSTQYFA